MKPVAVLSSGGLDSSILLADLAKSGHVFPIYVSSGHPWESEELRALRSFVSASNSPSVSEPVSLSINNSDIYGSHWSSSGSPPGADTPDTAVYLPGRNIFLITAAAVWGSINGVSRIAIGSLRGNPFPDASQEFYAMMGTVLGQGLARSIEVIAPYLGSTKEEIIRCNKDLPLHLTYNLDFQPKY